MIKYASSRFQPKSDSGDSVDSCELTVDSRESTAVPSFFSTSLNFREWQIQALWFNCKDLVSFLVLDPNLNIGFNSIPNCLFLIWFGWTQTINYIAVTLCCLWLKSNLNLATRRINPPIMAHRSVSLYRLSFPSEGCLLYFLDIWLTDFGRICFFWIQAQLLQWRCSWQRRMLLGSLTSPWTHRWWVLHEVDEFRIRCCGWCLVGLSVG